VAARHTAAALKAISTAILTWPLSQAARQGTIRPVPTAMVGNLHFGAVLPPAVRVAVSPPASFPER
jgi:hypothetical protein